MVENSSKGLKTAPSTTLKQTRILKVNIDIGQI